MRLLALTALVAALILHSAGAREAPEPARGEVLFRRVWTSDEGAGPLANAQSCAACHTAPTTDDSGASREAFVRLSPTEPDPTGGHVFRQFWFRPGRAVVRRPLPARVFLRRPPSLAGLGVLGAAPAAAIAARADPEDRDGDGVSGRMPAGRFGWKARLGDLEQAVAAALVNELGLTTSRFPTDSGGGQHIEVRDRELQALTEFVRRLAPAAPRGSEPEGRAVFDGFGCGTCHVPRVADLVDEHGRPVEAFTDLLVHDMGALGADVPEGNATAEEFRTAPLWGVGASGPPYLHDGRAPTLDAAIRAHDGEGHAARTHYAQATPARRAALLRFLGSL